MGLLLTGLLLGIVVLAFASSLPVTYAHFGGFHHRFFHFFHFRSFHHFCHFHLHFCHSFGWFPWWFR